MMQPIASASPGQILHTGLLTRVAGKPAHVPYALRFLGPEDKPELVAFRERIFAGLPDIDAYYPEVPEFVDWHFGERGHTLGVEAGGRLIACAVLGVPSEGMPNFADDLPKALPNPLEVAHMASSMVDPDFRGNGLQRLLVAFRILMAVGLGRPHLLTRVAFTNPTSLRNMLACGFRIRQVLVMHGGRLRFLLHRPLQQRPWTFRSGGERWVPIADLDGQRRAIADGLYGCAIEWDAQDRPRILYAQPGEDGAIAPAAATPVLAAS